jgi:hypothetical protein
MASTKRVGFGLIRQVTNPGETPSMRAAAGGPVAADGDGAAHQRDADEPCRAPVISSGEQGRNASAGR